MTDSPIELLHRADKIPTTLLSDILADHGHGEQVLSPRVTHHGGRALRISGWAYTVTGQVVEGIQGPDVSKARAIDDMPQGAMAVWAGGGVEDVCMFGDLLALAMQVRGVRGAVVDGGVRDIDDIEALEFPVWARYITPRASTGIWRVQDAQVPVQVTGTLGVEVTIQPGDLVVADANGVVSIPTDAAADVVQAAEAHLGREGEIRTRIERAESVAALLEEYGRI